MSHRYVVDTGPDGQTRVRRLRDRRGPRTPHLARTLDSVSRMDLPIRTRLAMALARLVGRRQEVREHTSRMLILSHLAFFALIFGPLVAVFIGSLA